MSNAISDMNKRDAFSAAYYTYLYTLADCVRGAATVEAVISEATNGHLRHRLFGVDADVEQEVREKVVLLENGDYREWARLLWCMSAMGGEYKRIKLLSPWAQSVLTFVRYGAGFSNMDCPNIDNVIVYAGYPIYDCDTYMVAVGGGADVPEVVWVSGRHKPKE